MNKENPEKHSLQLATLRSIQTYAENNNLSFRQASFLAFHNLKRKQIDCGFNLKTKSQFYSSLKRFKISKMNQNITKFFYLRGLV